VMRRHRALISPDLRQLIGADEWAREEAKSIIASHRSRA